MLAWLAWRRILFARRVLIVRKSGGALSGVLVSRRGGFLVLKSAQIHEEGADPVPLDGDVVLDRTNVDFVQVLAPVEA